MHLTSDLKEVSMTNRLFCKVSMFVLLALVVCSTAIAQRESPSAFSQDSEHGCSNRTLVGDYGLTIEGTILDANLPIRGLVKQHYDGRGHITQVDHVVFGGYPPPLEWTPGTGTYTVNSDCTGSAVIISPSSAPPGASGPPPPLNIHFVIVDHGRKIKQVVDANAVVAVGEKVD
jgi:hypothetical protein